MRGDTSGATLGRHGILRQSDVASHVRMDGLGLPCRPLRRVPNGVPIPVPVPVRIYSDGDRDGDGDAVGDES